MSILRVDSDQRASLLSVQNGADSDLLTDLGAASDLPALDAQLERHGTRHCRQGFGALVGAQNNVVDLNPVSGKRCHELSFQAVSTRGLFSGRSVRWTNPGAAQARYSMAFTAAAAVPAPPPISGATTISIV